MKSSAHIADACREMLAAFDQLIADPASVIRQWEHYDLFDNGELCAAVAHPKEPTKPTVDCTLCPLRLKDVASGTRRSGHCTLSDGFESFDELGLLIYLWFSKRKNKKDIAAVSIAAERRKLFLLKRLEQNGASCG